MKSSPLRIRIFQFLTKLLDTGDWDRTEATFLLSLLQPKDTPEAVVPVWAKKCKVCGISISDVLVNSHYMVHDALWLGAGFEKKDVACIQCFEKVLGREVTVDDLTTAPINNMLRWALSKVVSSGASKNFMAQAEVAAEMPISVNCPVCDIQPDMIKKVGRAAIYKCSKCKLEWFVE